MPITFRDYGKYTIFNTYVDPNPSPSPPDSDFLVTKLTSTELTLSVNFQGINAVFNYSGQIDLSGLTSPIKNLQDLGIAQTQGKIGGTIQSLLVTINGENGGLLSTRPNLSFDDISVLLDSSNLAAMKRVLAEGDIYISSSTATDGNPVYLYGGNDTFYHNHPVLKYNDNFYGGDGIDTVVIPGRASNYTVGASKNIWDSIKQTGNLSGFIVTDTTKTINTLQVNEVERLKFADTNVALDVGPYQNAGAIYMLYKATFNRAPDSSGMGYWLSQVDSGKNLVTNIAQSFLSTPEFIAKYGTNPSNATYIDKLYQNVLGRSGDAGGVAYWNQQLDSGAVSKAAALVSFATLPEGASNVASLIANGIPYTEYLG